MSQREQCGSCGSSDLAQILDLGYSPLANAFPATEYEHDYAPTFPIRLLICRSCMLVQLSEVVDDDLLWRDEYGYYTGTSGAAVAHFNAYAERLHERGIVVSPTPFIVEIGSNDGTMLSACRRVWPHARVLGIDPAHGPTVAANAYGLTSWCESFTPDTVGRIISGHGQADLIIANNVAAHVDLLGPFLTSIRDLLAWNGRAVIEVQYLADLLVGNGFDLLYHEHRFFYSLTSLTAALRRVGLAPVAVEFVDTQGGSIRVTAVRESYEMKTNGHERMWLGDALYAERELADLRTYDGLQLRADRIGERLRRMLSSIRRDGATVGMYGAPAKATTLLHWTRTSDYISFAVDTTPAKIGRFMPGHATPIPVIAETNERAKNVDAFLLAAHNYLPFVMAKERDFLARGGRFIVPLPVPTLIGG